MSDSREYVYISRESRTRGFLSGSCFCWVSPLFCIYDRQFLREPMYLLLVLLHGIFIFLSFLLGNWVLLIVFVLSAGFYDAYYHKAQQVRAKMQELMTRMFQDVDVIL